MKGDGARLHAAARARLDAARADLLLPAALRLEDRQRSTMQALLDGLVRSIEDELRLSLVAILDPEAHAEAHAALSSGQVEIALPILRASDALTGLDLIAHLLRRAEEHRLHRLPRPREPGSASLLAALVRDRDAEVADAAMAVLIAQSRRFDHMLEPVIASPELPADLEHRLVWTVAAALRSYLVDHHALDSGEADAALAAAAAARLGGYDEGESLEARCMRLVVRLEALGRLDKRFIAQLLQEPGLTLFLSALARRCRIEIDAAWELLCDPAGRGAPLLLRAAGLDRADAGRLLMLLAGSGEAGDEDRLARQLDQFQTLGEGQAQAALGLWQVDPAYRAAIARVGARLGAVQ